MKQGSFYEVFLNLLKNLYDAKTQIIDIFPITLQSASHQELKDAFSSEFEEAKNQLQRLKKIFKLLNENPTGVNSLSIHGILHEAKEVIQNNFPPAVKDVAIIISAQKVAHDEIAGYGSARTLANHLSDAQVSNTIRFDEIADLLQETLDEIANADDRLTEIAEGGFFSTGINEEAQKQAEVNRS